MKKLIFILITVVVATVFTGCGTGIKIVDTWTSQDVSQMKQKSILVIASTNNKKARIGFESEIAKQLNAKGLNATASFSRFPTIDFEAEKTQKRKDLIKTILESEGYNGIVITVVKDVVERTITSGNDYYYTGGPWNSYYPSYYGGFYGYYATPYTFAVFVSGPETRDTCSDDYPPMCRPRPPCLCCRQSLPLGGFAHPCSLRDRANQSHPRFGGPRTDPPRSTIAPSCLGDGGGACYSRQACPILSCDCAEYFPSLFWPFSFSRAVF